MPAKKSRETKEIAETFNEMLNAFGVAVGEILDTPEVKKKAKEFAASVVNAAVKVPETKIEDEEERERLRNVGEAAKDFG